jgi:hypothetical protein
VTKSAEPAPIVTDIVTPSEKAEPQMSLAMSYQPVQATVALRAPTVDERIRAFLSGETNGGDVLRELYNHVLDEPVPGRLQAILRR